MVPQVFTGRAFPANELPGYTRYVVIASEAWQSGSVPGTFNCVYEMSRATR